LDGLIELAMSMLGRLATLGDRAQGSPDRHSGTVMRDEHKHVAHYLAKAENYRQKAKVVRDPDLKSALEAVAREYLAKAQELDHTPTSNGEK
jgi:hypothetical protein